MQLQGKVAIITGARQGLGRSIAERFAKEGARLVLNDLGWPRGGKTRNPSEFPGASIELVAGDVSSPRVAKRLVATAVKRYGRVDILVNNAGIGGSAHGDGPVTESREESWDRILRVNLKSVFLCCRYAIPEMIRGGGGAVINMSSVLALVASPKYFKSHAYAASKGAVISLTRAMAAYYAPENVRINAVCPGLIDTPLVEKSKRNRGLMRYVKEKQRLAGGLGSATDVASAVLFLASDQARLITGVTLPLDAGWSAGA